LLASLLVTGCAKNKSILLPDYPGHSEKEMTYALYNYFFKEFGFDSYWARPFFPVEDRWTASYKGGSIWVVKAYDIDSSYAGAWLVPEAAYYGVDYDKVEPYDSEAEAIASRAKQIANMPARPPFLRLSNSPKEDMIMLVQQYIAMMSAKEAENAFIVDIQRAVKTHYPLEWHIVYNESTWWLVADYYEYRVRVYIDPSTGKMTVSGDLKY